MKEKQVYNVIDFNAYKKYGKVKLKLLLFTTKPS